MDYKIVVDALRAAIAEEVLPDVPVLVGVLPTCDGLSLVVSGGTPTRFLDGSCLLKQQITVNAKAARQDAAVGLLSAASRVVHGEFELDGCQITGISVKRAPAQVGMDTAGNYLFSTVFEVRAFFPEG